MKEVKKEKRKEVCKQSQRKRDEEGQDKYYNYKGVVEENEGQINEDNNRSAIGAFKVAFCADTGVTYVYKTCEEIIKNCDIYNKQSMEATGSIGRTHQECRRGYIPLLGYANTTEEEQPAFLVHSKENKMI
eukprot:3921803-Ditylum_brightwellii.AAC.1